MKKTVLICIIILCITGCATWVKVGGPFESQDLGFSVDLPEGWRRYAWIIDALCITRDGGLLQGVRIKRTDLIKEIEAANNKKYGSGSEQPSKKKITPGMLPQEAAEHCIDHLHASPQYMGVTVIANEPAVISGLPGFKIICAFRSQTGLKKRILTYGLITGKWYYEITYDAPERYYFPRFLIDVEKIKDSFRILDEKT